MRDPGRRACALASIGTTWLNTSARPATSMSTAGCGVSTGTRIKVALVMILSRCSPCALRAGTTMRTPGWSTSEMLLIDEAAGTRNVVRRPMTTGPKSKTAARSFVIPMNATSTLPARNASIMSAGLWMRTSSCGTAMRRASSMPSSGLHPLSSRPSSFAKYDSISTATRSLPVGASCLAISAFAAVCAAPWPASPNVKVASASGVSKGDKHFMSGGLQAVLPDDRCGGRRGDEFDQRPGRVRLFRAGVDAGGEHGHPLELARQRADVIDAGEMHQLADLLEADLGLAARDEGADEHAGRGLLELALDLARDAQFLEHAEHIDPARAGGIADRFHRQQRLLQSVG